MIIATWVLAALTILGTYLNIKCKWQSFLIWCFTNMWWLIYNFAIGEYAQAFMFFMFLLSSMYGLVKWIDK